MAIQLEKLNVEELYQKVRGEVGEEAADAIKRECISGDNLASLTDDDLKELLPKLGPRKELQKFKDSFKPKVCLFDSVLTLTYGECEKYLSNNTIHTQMSPIALTFGLCKTLYMYTCVCTVVHTWWAPMLFMLLGYKLI